MGRKENIQRPNKRAHRLSRDPSLNSPIYGQKLGKQQSLRISLELNKQKTCGTPNQLFVLISEIMLDYVSDL